MAFVAVVAVGCTPPPVAEVFDGGTFPVRIEVAPQTVTTEFDILGLVQCSSTTVTPEVDIDGTLTVAPAALSEDSTKVTVPAAALELPASRVSAGSFSLTCDGNHVLTIGATLDFSATASVQTAVLDTEARTLELTDPTITITDARLLLAGAPEGTEPVELDPIDVTVPTISVPL
jgi:hypothetical protein